MDKGKMQMLRQIMELEFVCVELNLFLDTHPEDQRALQDFRQVSEELLNAKAAYEAAHGPLLNFGLGRAGATWQWICDPWPWEINWKGSV